MALLEMGQVSEPLNLHPCKGGHVESGGTVEAHAWAAARNTAQSARDAVCSLVVQVDSLALSYLGRLWNPGAATTEARTP